MRKVNCTGVKVHQGHVDKSIQIESGQIYFSFVVLVICSILSFDPLNIANWDRLWAIYINVATL